MTLLNFPLCGYIKVIKGRGWLDEYSKDHVLIRAIEGRLSLKDVLHNPNYLSGLHDFADEDVPVNFLTNFTVALESLEKEIGEKNMERFVKNQLSAGKKHYDHSQFLSALAEIHIIKYFTTCYSYLAPRVSYEPPLSGGKNPEVRIEFNSGYTLDIEVKTPHFRKTLHTNTKKIMPLYLLNDTGKQLLKNLAEEDGFKKHLNLILPRVRKMKEFLNSAGEKFEEPTSDRHFNLLFINWTYSDFMNNAWLEPQHILLNDKNGLLIKKECGRQLEVSDAAYRKISTVISFCGVNDMLINHDFRYVFINRQNLVNAYNTFNAVHSKHYKTNIATFLRMNFSDNFEQKRYLMDSYIISSSEEKFNIDDACYRGKVEDIIHRYSL